MKHDFINRSPSTVGRRSSAVDRWPWILDNRFLGVDHRPSTVDCRPPFVGHRQLLEQNVSGQPLMNSTLRVPRAVTQVDGFVIVPSGSTTLYQITWQWNRAFDISMWSLFMGACLMVFSYRGKYLSPRGLALQRRMFASAHGADSHSWQIPFFLCTMGSWIWGVRYNYAVGLGCGEALWCMLPL